MLRRMAGSTKPPTGGTAGRSWAADFPRDSPGRIGVTVSPANPDRVWAIVNAHDPDGGVYRSDDAGKSWTKVNRDRKLRQRHWYYSHIVADPGDENTVYAMNTGLYRSIDAGKTWEGSAFPTGTSTTCGSIRRTRTSWWWGMTEGPR